MAEAIQPLLDQKSQFSLSPETKSALVITGKCLFIATVIAGLVATMVLCPPVGGAVTLVVIAGWLCVGASLSTIGGLIFRATSDPSERLPESLGNMFRNTENNLEDCGIFALSSLCMPFVIFSSLRFPGY
jgi:hypothetical protein